MLRKVVRRLTAGSSCLLGSCGGVPGTSPQTRGLSSHARPCPPSSSPRPDAPAPGGSIWGEKKRRGTTISSAKYHRDNSMDLEKAIK